MEKVAPMQKTEEEMAMIKQFLLLPVVLDVLAHDIRVMQASKIKMNKVYVKYLQGLQDRASLELFYIRRQLREHGIKVYRQERTTASLDAEYMCRGYHHRFEMTWEVVKGEVEIVLARLMGGV